MSTENVVTDFDLDNFSWDSVPVEENVVKSVKEAEESSEPPIENTGESSEKSSKEKPEKVIVVTNINEKGEPEESEESTKDSSEQKGSQAEKNDSPSGVGTGTETLRLLKEKGLIDYTDEEIQTADFDEESFIEEKYEQALDAKLEGLLTKLPQGLKEMIRFASQGGDYMEVVKDLNSPQELSQDLDLEDEENQKAVIIQSFKKEGKSVQDALDYIDFLSFKDKLEDEAAKRYDKYLVEMETQEERRIVAHKQEMQRRNQEIEDKKNAVSEFLQSNSDVLGAVKFSRTERKDLPNYMYSADVELEDGRVTTKFNYDLVQALQDKEKALLIAKITKSGFDMKGFMKDIETKVVSKIENGLQDRNFGNKGNPQIQTPKTNLVEYL